MLNQKWAKDLHFILHGLNKNKEMKKTVLLIDDDYLDVESVKRAFKKLNVDCDLHVAHNGADGLTMLTGSASDNTRIIPDIIILDINMPKMSGVEFLRIIKNYYSLKNIKIFILTTSMEEYDKFSTENLGIDAYIIKPLSFKDPVSPETKKLIDALLN
jgi:CheY-like chemotaxis protein